MLREIIGPTPKCPRCDKYLVKRRTIIGDMVLDCPECQSIYEEVEEKDVR